MTIDNKRQGHPRLLGSEQERDALWHQLKDLHSLPWDMVVIGGGITGAGVLREAVRHGLRVLLVEQKDFAWGTSSRSSKMVHGGLRYIASGDIKLTRESVTERERLLNEAPGLVDRMAYLFTNRKGVFPGRRVFGAVLSVYDVLAGRRDHRYLKLDQLLLQAPRLNEVGLKGATQYSDAVTDDARLVLRVINESIGESARALNYAEVVELIKDAGKVAGVKLRNTITQEEIEVRANVVVNATGAWADRLRQQQVKETKIRPLRGSHLIFPAWRFPVSQSITFMHPQDKRPVYIFPWEGVTVVGTTDLDHDQDMRRESRITMPELDYLMAAVNSQFSSVNLTVDDILATYSGVRPVIGSGAKDPSKEKREHSVWEDNGLVTVTGGKLTTFRLIALDVLAAAKAYLPAFKPVTSEKTIFSAIPDYHSIMTQLEPELRRRLLGRYGDRVVAWLKEETPNNLERIPGCQTLWAELKWTAETEMVCHLDDLLLRRTRIGLLLPEGGQHQLQRIREICQPVLGWNDERWQAEEQRYLKLWRTYYGVPSVHREMTAAIDIESDKLDRAQTSAPLQVT